MMTELNPTCRIDTLSGLAEPALPVDVLRLDLLHPVISGNKWFKLQQYLEEARNERKSILTFGGAYSNHIIATAATAAREGLKCIGIIRGERAPQLSHTLRLAEELGMALFFTTRTQYRQKHIPEAVWQRLKKEAVVIIPEGGYGQPGVEGAARILLHNDTSAYTHIITAVGTGTTLAGLVVAAQEHQAVVGIPVLKNSGTLQDEIRQLLPPSKQHRLTVIDGYHYGGYARHTPGLIRFMNEFYRQSGIPTDFVYTAKAFSATFDLLQKGHFSSNDKILLVHTGGLQGNESLPKGTLIF